MADSPTALLREQVQHLRLLADSLAARAMSGERAAIDNLLLVQNQLLELSHYLHGQPVEALTGLDEAPAPMDMAPFRVPAPPLYAQPSDELPLDGQPGVTLPPAPWDFEPDVGEREEEA